MSIEAGDRAQVAHFIRVCGSGVIATTGDDGAPQAARVTLTATADGVVLFDARTDSRKIANIERRPQVALVVTGGDVSVQLEGMARITWDDERVFLAEQHAQHHPGSRALADGFSLVAVDVRWARVYDSGAHPATTSEAHWEPAPPYRP